jgi:metal-dependent amidase/aminoacylase/carboxypeptidase family protein
MALNDCDPAGIALSNGLGQPIQDDSAMPLQDLIKADLPFLRSLRQDLHAHPELGFEEERTSGIVASLLEEAGLRVHRGLGKTGVVGTLQVGNGTRTIGLRADMDALAMPEQAERPYKSKFAGKMHACGHDGHTTLLLGAARHLAKTRDFSGTKAVAGQRRWSKMGSSTSFPAMPSMACTTCRV